MVLKCDHPDHRDDTPSLHIYPDHTYCYGCHKWEGWLDHCRRRGVFADRLSEPAPFAFLVEEGSRQTSRGQKAVTLSEGELKDLAKFYSQKLWTLGKQDWLLGRGLAEATIRRFQLGHTGRAYTIPIWEGEKLHTIRFRKDERVPSDLDRKYWGMAGMNEVYLYAPAGLGPKTILVEGEFDCLIAVQLGYSAITFTNGIGSFTLTPWAEQFSGVKHLVIATDQDGPGREGALRIGKEARALGLKVSYPTWREKDLTDLYLSQGPEGLYRKLGGANAPIGNPD